MRSAGNFHPEWGYLAPAPSFVRTLRIVLVATAIGATAGAAVVVSLVARPGASSADSSIAAHALVTGAPAVNSASAVPPAQEAAPAAAAAIAAVPAAAAPNGPSGEIAGASGNPSGGAPPQMANVPTPSPGAAPAHTAHIEEPAAAPFHEDTAIAPEGGANKKAAAKKHRVAGYEAMRRWQSKKPRHSGGGGFATLFRLFSSRSGSPFSTN